MSSTFEGCTHPVLACADAIEAALKESADVQVMFMDPDDKRAALLRLARLDAQLAALRLRVMAVSDDVAVAEGARDVAALLTQHTLTDYGANRRDLTLAEALDRRWTLVAEALGQGDLNVAQARVITHALDELPTEKVSADLLSAAEAHLVAQAAHFGPRELRVLGRRILEVVAPEIFEQHEAEQLAQEERRARRRTSLVSTRLGDGTTRITINVPDAVATRLHTYLEAFTSPRHQGAGEADRIPVDRKRGQAFCSLLEVLDPQRLPAHGGDATTLIVTVSARGVAPGARHRRARSRGQADRRRGTTARLHRPDHPSGARREVRGPRPGPILATVPTSTTQGDDHPRPRVPRRGMHHPSSLVRGPPLGHTLVPGRPHRPQGRPTAVLLAPPPGTRPHLRLQPDAQR